ncbi:unnamed protein product [Camellia sinensis]
MLLRRFEHEKQKTSSFDSWQGTIPIIDNTSVFLDMELLQELSQIVLVDAEELQLGCFMPMEYRQLECNAQGMLVLSWHMKAATMCEFSKQEFIGGLQALGIDSLEKFCDRIQFMHSELKDERIRGQKSLALDTAIGMWQLLFEEKQWPLVDHWCQFLQ